MIDEDIHTNGALTWTRRGFARLAAAALVATGIGSPSLTLVAAREVEPGDDHGGGGGGQDDSPGDDRGSGGQDDSPGDDRGRRRGRRVRRRR